MATEKIRIEVKERHEFHVQSRAQCPARFTKHYFVSTGESQEGARDKIGLKQKLFVYSYFDLKSPDVKLQ